MEDGDVFTVLMRCSCCNRVEKSVIRILNDCGIVYHVAITCQKDGCGNHYTDFIKKEVLKAIKERNTETR